jgi:hypothetical protein
MGFFDRLRKAFSGGGAAPSDSGAYWVYAQCRRCGEPLKGRIDLRNEPSQADEGDTWIVRKGLLGTGARRCFQTVEVVLTFDSEKKEVIDSEVTGGKLISEDEYNTLLNQAVTEQSDEGGVG